MAFSSNRPRVLLFDIGGVCVVSPFQAIIDYEKNNDIPAGYINWCISQIGRNGAWARMERGELVLNHLFYDAWKKDLADEPKWRTYYARHLEKQGRPSTDPIPPVPEIDTQFLHTELMSMARTIDPHMGPALKKLRRAADESNGKLIIAALSNTSIAPKGHPLYDSTIADCRAARGLDFDVFISSAHVGMRKPDEEIYKYTIIRLHEYVKTKEYGDGVKPQDITFLDDIGENLRTARRLGMNTIKVQLGKTELAVKELEKITGLRLSDDAGSSKL